MLTDKISEVWIERTYTPPSYMCLSAVARSNKVCIVVTIDWLVGVQRSAIVRCADVLLNYLAKLKMLLLPFSTTAGTKRYIKIRLFLYLFDTYYHNILLT